MMLHIHLFIVFRVFRVFRGQTALNKFYNLS
jgi:hypothetical protein